MQQRAPIGARHCPARRASMAHGHSETGANSVIDSAAMRDRNACETGAGDGTVTGIQTRGWHAALAAAAALHMLLSLIVPQWPLVFVVGTGAFLLIAIARCIDAARREPARTFRWVALAVTLLLWLASYIVYPLIPRDTPLATSHAAFDTLLEMARMAPLFLLLAHNPATSAAPFRHVDMARAALFVLIASALLFPGMVSARADSYALGFMTAYGYNVWLKLALALFALIAWAVQPTRADRRFIGHVALLWVASVAVSITLNGYYLANGSSIPDSSLYWWPADLPFILFVLATLRPARDAGLGDHGFAARQRNVIAESIRRVAPSLLTAAMLAMALVIATRTPLAGLILGACVIGLHAVRSLMIEVRYVTTLDALETAHDTMSRLAERDHLTGIANRRAFDAELTDTWSAMRAQHQPFALLMIDLDAFKAFNEVAGSAAGDQCLQRCSWLLQAELGPDDLIARYGGAEFVVLARTASLHGAMKLAERLRLAIADEAIAHPASTHSIVTVSIGVAVAAAAPGDRTTRALLARVDDALARAKARGRNRVETAAWPLAAAG